MALRAGYYGIKRGLKAKLAEIAGAWDEVINEVKHTLPDGIIANTQLIADTVGFSAKNELDTKTTSLTIDSVTYTFTQDSDGYVTVSPNNNDARTWGYTDAQYKTTLKKGKHKLCVQTKTSASQSWVGIRLFDSSNNLITRINQSDIPSSPNTFMVEFTLNADTQIGVCAKIADGAYRIWIVDGDILDPTYEPYFGSTVETILSDHKTTINAIITAATEAADFAAFKTAMGAITPVTRSLSREASPEDVPEEVIEEEKPVTRKTTKKTVKEGE